MKPLSLIVVVALLSGGSTRAAAQETPTPPAADPGRPTHGIIRKPQPKPSEPAKSPAPETGKPAESAKKTPTASTEEVAAAIANAVRALEEKGNKKPEPAPASAAHAGRSQAAPAVAKRRYSVNWPSQRFEVQWAAPDDRITLSWDAAPPETGDTYGRWRLEP